MISPDLLKELNIIDWGYTEEPVPRSNPQYREWTNNGLHGPLSYLNDHRKELRSDLRKLWPEFQSALVFLFDYRSAKKWMMENNNHRIAAYALGFEGADYHEELRERLRKIQEALTEKNPDLKFFLTLDIQPVLERDLAYRAGLGWFGKNSMLINQKEGSYFIIGSLLLNQKLPLTVKENDIDHCGTCTACADACPTNAIDVETRTLRAQDCISTFTIEIMKEAEPPTGFEKSRGEIFGCDICQDVCPWNRKPLDRTSSSLDIAKYPLLQTFLTSDLLELQTAIDKSTGRGLQKSLAGTALARPGKKGWAKNLIARIYFQPK